MSDRYRPRSRSRSRSRSRDHSRDHHRDSRRSRHRSRSRSRSRDDDRRRRRHSPSPHRRQRSPGSPLPPPSAGTILRGKVVSLRPFGIFVDLPGYRRQALVHCSQISEEVHFGRDDDDDMKIKALEFFCPRGEEVWLKITEIRDNPDHRAGASVNNLKIAGSMKAVDQNTGADLDPDNLLTATGGGGGGPGGGRGGSSRLSDAPPELYSIHRAAVKTVRHFGVFVQLEGYHKYGLVHISQISDHLTFLPNEGDSERIAAISEILSENESVFVKVVELGEPDERGNPKVGCSIKLVSQRDGTDLDPGNVKYKPRGEGGAGGGQHRGHQPIGAAAAGVAQHNSGVVEWGHLKADVVNFGGGDTKYDILAPEEDDFPPQAAGRGGGRGVGAPLYDDQGPPLPPMGRGRGSVMPSWMTSNDQPAAPGSGVGVGGDAGGPIKSVEDALAVLEAYGVKHSKKEKKHKSKDKKKSSKHKKDKNRRSSKDHRHRHKKESRRRRHGSSDSSSDSDSR